MKLSRYEQETIILFNEEEKTANVYTCNNALLKKLDAMCKDFPEQVQLDVQDEYSKTYIIPKKLVSIRKPVELSEQRKKEMAERMRQVRKDNPA